MGCGGYARTMNDATAQRILEQLIFIANNLQAIERRLQHVEAAIQKTR